VFKARQNQPLADRLRDLVWPRMGFRRALAYLGHRMARLTQSPHHVAMGFAAGAFAAFTPLVGFHFVIAGIIAWAFDGSILASAIGTTIGNPLTYPLIWFSSYEAGAVFLGEESAGVIDLSPLHGAIGQLIADPAAFAATFWHVLEPVLVPLTIGSTLLGALAGLACYAAVRPLVRAHRERRLVRIARAASSRAAPGRAAAP
jgi:uncharacterized protein (DUF2062 family)